VVTRNRRIAEPGIIDWSEASQGDALYDLAALRLAHEEHRAWWSFRSLDRDQVAGRERLRLAGELPRGGRAAITNVRLREPLAERPAFDKMHGSGCCARGGPVVGEDVDR
jgi:hypothetical protein